MFLANENFPKQSITETCQGVTDPVVLDLAITNQLIILTFDRDYGELIFRHAPQNPPAVIYFKDKGNNPLFAGELLLRLLQQGQIQFANCFSVLEETNIRQRFYTPPHSEGLVMKS